MAKLGQLWLNGGKWDGRQIVSSDWVKAAATAQSRTSNEDDDYGYGWWIVRESAVSGQYGARGRGSQYVEVFPALNVIVVLTGAGAFSSATRSTSSPLRWWTRPGPSPRTRMALPN